MASIPENNLSDTDLGGRTLSTRVYKFNTSARLTGALSLVDEQHDTQFFVEITLPYNSWIVIGVFYPPRLAAQGRLFT